MAKFTLSAITTSGEVLLTYFDADSLLFGGLTFDEALNTSTDTASLTFSALKYRVEGNQQIINLPITSLTYGTVIRLRERNNVKDFKVQSINYSFLPNNLQLRFTCLDRFQAEANKIAIGYTITADTTDPDFLGAQAIDVWARKIITETNLPWGYIGVDEANDNLIRQLANANTIYLRDDLTQSEEWAELNDALINEYQSNPATLNNIVSFECSNSNAFEALKKLASDNELILQVDYLNNNIYFIPQKNWWFKGYYFNPHINLQQMGLQGDGQNIATVLNVTGPKDINDQEITLVPSIPGDFETYVNTPEWSESVYYPGFFQAHSTDKVFAALAEQIPWLENKIIDTSFYRNKLISQHEAEDINNTLNNTLRKINAPLMIATRAHYKNVEKWMMQLNQDKIEAENAFGAMVSILDTCYNSLPRGDMPHSFVALYDGESLLLPVGARVQITVEGRTGEPYHSLSGWVVIPWSQVKEWPQPAVLRYYSNNEPLGTLTINAATKQGVIELPQTYIPPILAGQFIPELDYFLNEHLSTLNSAWQTLNKNAYLLKIYWEGPNEDYEHESFYRRFRHVGVLTTELNEGLDVTMDEGVHIDAPYSAVPNAGSFSYDDLQLIANYFGVEPPADEHDKKPIQVTRSQVIQECANIAAKMNDYWKAMRDVGLQQGCYLPPTWDCLDTQYSLQIYGTWFGRLMPLQLSSNHYKLSNYYGGTANISADKEVIIRYRYFDQQRDALSPLQTNNSVYYGLDPKRVVQSNTYNYYTKTDLSVDDPKNLWFSYQCKRTVLDTVQLYQTRLKYRDYTYDNGQFITGKCFINTNTDSIFQPTSAFNSIICQFYQQLLSAYVEGTTMYKLQSDHNEIWRHLYSTYPGVFCETVYENTDAATSMDLYFAAKAKLNTLNHPEFSYNLTGIDIYSRDNKLLLWDVKLGDQVRIDYIEDEHQNQIVDQALQEPLYVTGINHSLRDDANYQFEVATRKATDTMVRRFAQLLTLGR